MPHASPQDGLTHTDGAGKASMVDVSAKRETAREARARGAILMHADTLDAIEHNTIAKGDVLAAARIAAVMAAKKTAELIPLCHPIALNDVQVELAIDKSLGGVRCDVIARTIGRTGVEMEAMTAVSVALLTIYDMAKARDREMRITNVELVEKSGGRSGLWKRG